MEAAASGGLAARSGGAEWAGSDWRVLVALSPQVTILAPCRECAVRVHAQCMRLFVSLILLARRFVLAVAVGSTRLAVFD